MTILVGYSPGCTTHCLLFFIYLCMVLPKKSQKDQICIEKDADKRTTCSGGGVALLAITSSQVQIKTLSCSA